jgi:hypothetical protein
MLTFLAFNLLLLTVSQWTVFTLVQVTLQTAQGKLLDQWKVTCFHVGW